MTAADSEAGQKKYFLFVGEYKIINKPRGFYKHQRPTKLFGYFAHRGRVLFY